MQQHDAQRALLALFALYPVLIAAEDAKANSGESDPGHVQDPNAAGASGDDTGAFSLSKAGLIAIICVVSIVVGLGAISLTLWYIAKKRQWEVRASFRRVSRRLTGRLDDSRSKRQTRRTGVRMASPPSEKKRHPNKEIDVEKAEALKTKGGQKNAGTSTTITSQFDVDTPRTKTWKEKLFGAK
ncbi:hypothetical protein EJ05DRAFT_276711 [Pseudovirgaria hyperparasitica]|uniref:Mid2 domain-containing protein n=1 Tax=Pseudovirgaria hyperparasitica TaxID=470096 RepID=A0A6A6WDI4_9PEZI|nr:uncharacterized protein EJ05DRAFT_276711 [Pseudovirgaria hyperparasitica]KAF2760239.1 hypothetical protein EJ05DRAFT_276711 [Pseudovirgaria hyperparasitica]